MMTGTDAGVKRERGSDCRGVVIPDVEVSVIGARGEEVTGSGPAGHSQLGQCQLTENIWSYLKALTQPV